MQLRRWGQAFAILSLLACASGCGTVGRMKQYPRSPQIYGGVRTHLEHFPAGHVWDWLRDDTEAAHTEGSVMTFGLVTSPWILVDFPLSLVTDTLVLPVTLLASGSMKPRAESAIADAHQELSEVTTMATSSVLPTPAPESWERASASC